MKDYIFSKLYLLKDPKWSGALIMCAILGASILVLSHRATSAFETSYEGYAALAATTDNSAFIPGAQDNPVRAQINELLTSVLSDKMSDADRALKSHEGLKLLDQSNVQIDNIGKDAEPTALALEKLDLIANNASDFAQKDTMRSIVALAKQRASIIEDIRGLSYRANFETANIFNRIISEGGKLTDAHVTELNNEVPDVEGQFNKRHDLYDQLNATISQIQEKHADSF
jgi:hypothetical protein